MRSLKHVCIARVVLAVLAPLGASLSGSPAAAQPVIISSTFDTNAEGWSITGNGGSGPTWVSSGGVAGGYISATDQAGGVYWYFRAPSKFLGNKGTAYGQNLTFHLKQSATDSPGSSDSDVVLVGPGLTLVYDATPNPDTNWTLYTVPLNESAGWRKSSLAGEVATAAEIQGVLAGLTELRIRGEYRSGSDTGGLDSVTMVLTEAPPPVTLPVVSRFDANDEGWTVYGDAQGSSVLPTYQPSGGNPGGHLTAKDDVAGGVWYWRAPAKFLGNVATAYGHSLSFDLKQSTLADQFNAIDIVLSDGSTVLVFDTPNNPGLDWTRYVIPVHESAGWRHDTGSGILATGDTIRNVLANLLEIRIRGEFVSGADTGSLDNVVFGGAPLVYGDADGNGIVQWRDVQVALGTGAGLRSDGNLALGDVAPRLDAGYGDGRLTPLDAARIARYLTGLETAWP